MGYDGRHQLTGVKFVNLTPHEIVVQRDLITLPEGEPDLIIPSCGKVVRVISVPEYIMEVNGCQVVRSRFIQETEGDPLPPPEIGTIYIVSTLVAMHYASQRDDLLAPDTGPQSAVRDASGQIVAVRRFQVFQ